MTADEKGIPHEKRAPAANEELLSYALTTAGIGVWDLDLTDHTVRRSLEYDRVFGYDALQPRWTHQRFLQHVVPEDRSEVDAAFRRAIAGGGDWTVECRIARPDGETRWIRVAGRLHTDRAGRQRIAGMVQDVTEQKRSQEELREARARVEEVERRKSQFIAMLSHELRNPLAPIKNSLYILDRVPSGSVQARRARDVIERQIEQLTHLVDDLLDVNRAARGKIQLQRHPLELNELVRRTIEDHRTALDRAELQVELEPAAAQVFVFADWNRVAQALGNLLLNAAKFTPRGGRVTIAVTTDAAAGEAVVRVADTGAGMTADVLERLFEPFMQADPGLDQSVGGLGLGLALVKGIVEQHGGSVEARSDGPGRGSQFTVRLPIDPSGAVEPERERPARATPPRRVLVIEDNVDAADSLRDMLELDGHVVAVAYDGPQGIVKARENRPEYVLCDIGLPGMNGYDVARVFRADPSLRTVHLVALSGYALPEDLQRAAEAGFELHLAKPPTRQKLESVLGGVLDP